MSKNLSTTIAAYADLESAELDWLELEAGAQSSVVDLADAALVRRTLDGTIDQFERQSHHGWGKGAMAGAVVGILFPPSLVAGAIAGGVGGAVVARLNRSLDRNDIKDLGDVMDSGEIALVAVTTNESVDALRGVLTRATSTVTKESASADEVREALSA